MRSIRGFVRSIIRPGRTISRRLSVSLLILIGVGLLASFGWSSAESTGGEVAGAQSTGFQWAEPLLNTAKFPLVERVSLLVVLGVAVLGLLYAGMLVKQVLGADRGTKRMQEIARRFAKAPTPIWRPNSARSVR